MCRQAPGRLLAICRALEVAPLKPLGAIQLRAPPHLRERKKLQEKAAQDLAMNGTAAGESISAVGVGSNISTRAGQGKKRHITGRRRRPRAEHCCRQE